MTDCDEAREQLPELVLGVLGGDERARVLAHVVTCGRCQGEAEALVRVTGSLLELVPAVDPPAGFESRLLARRSGLARVPRRRPRAVLAAAAAALVLLGAGAGIGAAATGGGGAGPTAVAARLVAPSGRVGEVVAVTGHPGFLAMSVDLGGWSGRVRCVAVESDGHEVDLGSFLLQRGYGSWTATFTATSVTAARVVTASGRTLASASFSTAV